MTYCKTPEGAFLELCRETMNLTNKFGVMQEIIPIVNDRIQIFPIKNWKFEFERAKITIKIYRMDIRL